MTTTIEVPASVARDLARLRQYYPYRHIWCACKDGEWQVGATLTRREPNKMAREGWQVFAVTGAKK